MRKPIRIGDYRGFRYAELEPDLLERVPRWLAEGRVSEGTDLKAGRVFRFGSCAVKFGNPRRRLRDSFRPSRAIRSADLHAKLLPIATPRPYLALEKRAFLGTQSDLLLCEFIAGQRLFDLWLSDRTAVAAFPTFLSELHARGIFHGDFHLENALWNGNTWYLIDLEGVRHRLHGIRARKFLEAHWAIVCFSLEYHCRAGEAELRSLFDDYWNHLGRTAGREMRWNRIRRLVKRHWTNWNRRPAES